jgi:hypothetical protein
MTKIDITGFRGAEHVQRTEVSCYGDPAEFRPIVERTIAFVRNYAETLGSGDLSAAYALTGASLRERMDFDKFVRIHQKAEREFHGPALEYLIEMFVYVLADDAARNDPSDHGWHKNIPRPLRRARIIGFWIRDRSDSSGCRGRLWITEEDGEYRLADFDFYGD